MPELQEKEQILAWYKSFQKQMKEKYGVDLTKKTDLSRIRFTYYNEKTDMYNAEYAFMRHRDGQYTVPEPKIPHDGIFELVGIDRNISQMVGEKAEEANKELDRKTERLFAEHEEWEISNQTAFSPEREEDFEDIARLYRGAQEGTLFLMNPEPGSTTGHERTIYMGDDGSVCLGPYADADELKYEIQPGVTATARTIFEGAIKGRITAKEGDTEAQKRYAEKRNAYVDFLEQHIDGWKTPNDEERSAYRSYMTGNIGGAMKQVEKPGIRSFFKWVFSGFRDTGDYDAYREYQRQVQRLESAKTIEKQFRAIEKELLRESNYLPEIRDIDRKYQVLSGQTALSSTYPHIQRDKVDALMNEHNTLVGEDTISSEVERFFNFEQSRVLLETAQHPEYFNPNGKRSADGRAAYNDRTMTAEEKKAACDAYRKELEKARTETLEHLEAAFADEYAKAEPQNSDVYAQDLGILLKVYDTEQHIDEHRFRKEYEMKADDIKALGRALSGTGAFREMVQGMPDMRKEVFDFMELCRDAFHDAGAQFGNYLNRLSDCQQKLNEEKKDVPAKEAVQKTESAPKAENKAPSIKL